MKPQCLETSTWQAQITTGVPWRLTEASALPFQSGVQPHHHP